MRKAWIVDMVTVTPFGDDFKSLWQAILEGKSAIRPVKRFPVENYQAGIASYIEDLIQIDKRSLVHLLLDRLINRLGPVPPDAVLITASTKSGIDNLEKVRRGEPADPGDVLFSNMLDSICRKLELKGEGMNISAACVSSTIAIAQAALMIASGHTNTVLVCCMDLVTEFVFSGFSALQALSDTPSRPFDRERNGLSLGEGAAALLLMSDERAKAEGRSHLGTILGWGAANDSTHVTAPARDGCGLKQAILQALQLANCKASDIVAICAHGTGTVYNDLMELNAFNGIFNNPPIPIFSIKGSIGHTLGAAGGIEVAVGLQALSDQIVPPTVGFSYPENGAEGRIASNPVDIPEGLLLTTNSGFGGINAAVVLEKGITM